MDIYQQIKWIFSNSNWKNLSTNEIKSKTKQIKIKLPTNNIGQINCCLFSNQSIWIGTNNGLILFSQLNNSNENEIEMEFKFQLTERTHNYSIDKLISVGNFIWSIDCDSNLFIWK